jgi:hypothetical protein
MFKIKKSIINRYLFAFIFILVIPIFLLSSILNKMYVPKICVG